MKQRAIPTKIVTQRSGPTTCATTTLPQAMYDAFERLAHADGMTKSAKLRQLVDDYIADAAATQQAIDEEAEVARL